jgi:hypothetical protein
VLAKRPAIDLLDLDLGISRLEWKGFDPEEIVAAGERCVPSVPDATHHVPLVWPMYTFHSGAGMALYFHQLFPHPHIPQLRQRVVRS